MRPRGWLAVGALALATVIGCLPATAVVSPPSTQLTLSIPGPFLGCGYFGAGTNESLRAVLDLVRPSAFLTGADGSLQGEDGPITSAELVSLNPQTVTYTVQPGWSWSNGTEFTIADLVAWDHQATRNATTLADGYRDIATLTPSPSGTQLTAVFATPYADWNTLFRDVNERGTAATCTLASLATQPSLGPYTLRSITPTRAVLARNPAWLGAPVQFTTVVVTTTLTAATLPGTPVVDYEYDPSPLEVSALADHPHLDGSTAMTDQIVAVGFSPRSALTSQLAVRQFLSLTLDRQQIIDDVAGPVSYDPGPADSVIYAQGQTPYLGVPGLGPFAQSAVAANTTLPTTTDVDCVSCAAPILRAAGFAERHGVWRTSSGVPVTLSLAVGPTPNDAATARAVITQWNAAGVTVHRFSAASDLVVTQEVRTGLVDVGIFTEGTAVSPGLTTRSWTGSPDADTYDLGWRSSLVTEYYLIAQDSFNPDDAASEYTSIDQYIAMQAWEHPLFTEPSVLMWSSDLATVDIASSLTGLVDECPTWGLIPNAN